MNKPATPTVSVLQAASLPLSTRFCAPAAEPGLRHGAGNADKKFVNSKNKLGVPPDDNRYILKRVWLSKEEEQGYYYGFANEGMWPFAI